VAGVGEAIELRLDGLDHLGVAVAGVDHGDAGGEIDVAAAFDIPDLGILSPVGIDLRGHADAAALEAEAGELDDHSLSAVGEATPQSQVGRKLRSLRHAAGKTLEQVAGDIGIAASVLSTLERTSQGVSVAVLHNLAEYFGTTVSSLSGEDEPEVRALVRSGEWRTWPRTTPGVTVQLLAEGRNQMDCHRFVLEPGASSEGAYKHEGEEFVYVLSGRVEFVLDSDQFHDLNPGDSLYFESRRHHAWSNRHDGETVLLWINTPPTF
jgi:transcriptional regulator with XRE-family HTH domain